MQDLTHEAVKPFMPLRQALARAAFKERYRQMRIAKGGLMPGPTPAVWPARIPAAQAYLMRFERWRAPPALSERLRIYKIHKAVWT